MKSTFFIACTLLFLFSCKLEPTDNNYINVPKDFTTIQSAINASVDGDTILVAPGTYYENINFNGKNITLASKFILEGNEQYIYSTIIDGSDKASVVTFENGETENAALIGFTIQNGKAYWGEDQESNPWQWHGGGILCYQSDPTLSFLNVVNNKAHTGAGLALYNSNSIINNIRIKNNKCIANYFGSSGDGGGIWAGGSYLFISDATISQNPAEGGSAISAHSDSSVINNATIFSNISGSSTVESYGRTFFKNIKIINNKVWDEFPDHYAGTGINGGGFSLENCIIANNGKWGIRAGGWYGSDEGSFFNISNTIILNHDIGLTISGINFNIQNCIFNNAIEFYLYPIEIDYGVFVNSILNISYSNILDIDQLVVNEEEPKSIVNFTNGNISIDPLFVDPDNGDFHLQSNSPCIDTGNPDTQYNDIDGSPNDMGAYGGPGGDW